MMPTGMIQMVFSGEAGAVNALHNYVMTKIPHGPHGAVKYLSRLKENSDGVTARMSIEVPPEFFDDFLGKEWRSAGISLAGETANNGSNDSSAGRYQINYRNGG